MNESIEKAANKLGGQTAAARLISEASGEQVTQGNVWSWIHRTGIVPAHLAPYFEDLTALKGDRVSKETLCPDFPWDKCCGKYCQQETTA